MTEPNTGQELKAALEVSHSWWNDMGVDIPAPPPNSSPTPPSAVQPKRRARTSTSQTKPAPKPPEVDTSKQLQKAAEQAKAAPTLKALKTIIEGFDAGVLSDHARNIVFSRGTPDANIMVIGEAPGRAEDESGKPFVGPAGQLLDKMFAAINLSEDSLYITNVCNWRPPANRNPTEDELVMCAPFIKRHMELIAPKLVVIVGGISLQALTGKTGIMKTRGRWQELDIAGEKVPAMPLYHPAFLLRRPELKKDAWRDLLAIKARLEYVYPFSFSFGHASLSTRQYSLGVDKFSLNIRAAIPATDAQPKHHTGVCPCACQYVLTGHANIRVQSPEVPPCL